MNSGSIGSLAVSPILAIRTALPIFVYLRC